MFAAITLLALVRSTLLGSPGSLVGVWDGHTLTEGRLNKAFDKMWICRLTLNKDGTFLWRVSDHVMTNIEQTGSGTYTVKGDRVHLHGHERGYISDSSEHHDKTEPLELDLTASEGELLVKPGSWPPVIFARSGKEAHVPASLGPISILRNPRAESILKQVADTYHHLKSYSDTGDALIEEVHSAPQKAKFTTYFVAPSRMRFTTQLVDGGRLSAQAEVWTSGKKSRYYSSLDDFTGVQTDRPVGDCFFSLSQYFGIEADLTPPLLLGSELPLRMCRQVLLQGTESVGQRSCWVIRVNADKDTSTIYWIDRSSHLILAIKEHSIAGAQQIRFHPKPTPPISASNLAPTKPRSFPL